MLNLNLLSNLQSPLTVGFRPNTHRGGRPNNLTLALPKKLRQSLATEAEKKGLTEDDLALKILNHYLSHPGLDEIPLSEGSYVLSGSTLLEVYRSLRLNLGRAFPVFGGDLFVLTWVNPGRLSADTKANLLMCRREQLKREAKLEAGHQV